MDAVQLLHDRQSAARLVAPAPQGAVRERVFAAALRAPDHGRLRPWRFLVVEGEGLARLGEAMARAMARHAPAADEAALAKLRGNPLRAPLVLVLLARTVQHPKVPELEQYLSVACAAHAMLLAAQAEGFGGMWRSGAVTWTPALHAELGLAPGERVLGFLYLGTPAGETRPPERPSVEAHFSRWPAGG
jgi:nitroreductase